MKESRKSASSENIAAWRMGGVRTLRLSYSERTVYISIETSSTTFLFNTNSGIESTLENHAAGMCTGMI